MSSTKRSSVFQFLLVFAVAYIASQFILKMFFPNQYGGESVGIQLSMLDHTIRGGHHPVLVVKNGTETPVILPHRCPDAPVDVFAIAQRENGEVLEPRKALETVLPCKVIDPIPPGETVQIDLGPWKYSLFGENGTYEVRLSSAGAEKPSTRFTIYEPGVIVKLFRTFITKPFLNFLIFVASLLSDRSLGVAIIVLTLLVKIFLFFPTQHALEGQKKMQKIQPKLDEIKQKYKSDPRKMQEETMKLWREYGVNPLGALVPMIIQFPILIGLFFVIRDGATLALSRHLIYPFYQHIDWTFGTQFLGFSLVDRSLIIFPISLALLQFVQMKLSFHLSERQKRREIIDVSPEKKGVVSPEQSLQQKVMLYALPLMIGFFALQVPIAVSLYWGVSTVFAIGQQMVVNRKKI